MKQMIGPISLFVCLLPFSAAAQQAPTQSFETEMLKHLPPSVARQGPVIEPTATHACFTTVACGTTLNGANLGGCFADSGLSADFYTIQGVLGQTVSVTATTSGNDSILVTVQDNDTGKVLASSPVSTRNVSTSYTFPDNRPYVIGFGTTTSFASFAYSLTVTCSGGGTTCTPTTTTMCLNDRFAVSATWRTTSATGNGTAVKLTSDTGYFWFFGASNVEVVIKVLNACTLNSKYWVFAGGLTDVNVVLTVRDTKTGTTRTYTNPLGVAFQPIQDTSALGVCP